MTTEDVKVKPGMLRSTYDSLDELARAAKRRAEANPGPAQNCSIYYNDDSYKNWRGGVTFAEAIDLAQSGWEDPLTETLELVESMVDKVEKAHEIEHFQAVWDVSGCEVDVARYLNGEPENMIDYPMISVPKHGRVITLCATVGAIATISPESMIRRGQVVTAFALLLSRLGYACELWADSTAKHGDWRYSVRTLVKGTNDTLDPSRVLYAYAHPSMLRALTFAVRLGMTGACRKAFRMDTCGGMGSTVSPERDMPEGTIYLDYIHDESMDVILKDLLKQAGILREES